MIDVFSKSHSDEYDIVLFRNDEDSVADLFKFLFPLCLLKHAGFDPRLRRVAPHDRLLQSFHLASQDSRYSMQITCTECGSLVQVNPPLFRCPTCDADLRDQIPSEAGPAFLPEDEVQGYYDRAAELAVAGNDVEALAEIERGLARVDASELHLLAALIHRRQQAYDQMRRHVAAIPVDDSLRGEAEWLVRSHQEEQRALRQATQSGKNKSRLSVDPIVRKLNRPDRASSNRSAEEESRPRRFGWAWLLPVAGVFALLIWWQAPLLSQLLGPDTFLNRRLDLSSEAATINAVDDSEGIPAGANNAVAVPTSTTPPMPASPTPASPTPASPTPASPTPASPTPASPTPVTPTPATPTPTPVTPTVKSTPLPSATPLPNVVEAPIATVNDVAVEPIPSPEPIASVDESGAVDALATSQAFDLGAFLRQNKRPDLAALPISARLQGGTLILQGTVSSTQNRIDLLALAEKLPGVDEVNGIDLLIRLPATYTVQADDSLWWIAVEYYGEGARWQEIFDANRNILGPDALLSPGQTLTLPPF